MFVEGIRLFVVVLGTAAGFWAARTFGTQAQGLGGMLGCLLGYVSGGMFGRVLDKALGVVERRVDRRSPARFVAGTLGAIAGSALALVLVLPAALLVPVPFAVSLVGLASWVFGYIGFRLVARQSEAVLELLGLSTRPLVRAQAFDARDGLLVDSSVVMDGQLLPLTRAGVLSGDLMVARFVLDEVQGFADATDDVKRRRARRGLEILDSLRSESNVRLYVLDDELPEIAEVDAKLIALARRLQLRLLTNDGPLARNASAAGRADHQPPQARAGADAEHRSRRLRARLADPRGQGIRPRRRPPRGRVDGRGERWPRARRRARGRAPGDVGRADRRRTPALRPPRRELRPSTRLPGFAWSSLRPHGTELRQTVRVKTWAIVVAAGGGSRFGAAKQFTRLGDVSVLDRAVGVAGSACDGVVVVLPAGSDWTAPGGVRIATGGDTRSASVRSGLACVPDDADVVVVHDAARPLATAALFARVVAAVRAGADAAVPGASGDRHGEAGGGRTGDRDGAARRPRRRPDAAGVPARRVGAGARRRRGRHRRCRARRGRGGNGRGRGRRGPQSEGDGRERHRARPRVDRRCARMSRSRVGLGFDVHPFGAAPPLVLGGVTIPDAPRLAGHSDGDAVAHAVADALLGPAGLPDLGTLFPAGDDRYRGADSMQLLAEVVGRVGARQLVAGERRRHDRGGDAPPRAPHGGDGGERRRGPRAAARADGARHRGVGAAQAGRGSGRDRAVGGIAVWAVALLSGG